MDNLAHDLNLDLAHDLNLDLNHLKYRSKQIDLTSGRITIKVYDILGKDKLI
ncbi:MAG: hypothetical protein AB1775_00865 [Bacteroidota bacterium]